MLTVHTCTHTCTNADCTYRVHTCTCVKTVHVYVLHVHIESVRISSSAQESDVLSSTARGSPRLCWRSPARWRTWRWTGPLAMSTGPPTHSTPTTTSRWPIEMAGFVRPWFEDLANLGDSFCIRWGSEYSCVTVVVRYKYSVFVFTFRNKCVCQQCLLLQAEANAFVTEARHSLPKSNASGLVTSAFISRSKCGTCTCTCTWSVATLPRNVSLEGWCALKHTSFVFSGAYTLPLCRPCFELCVSAQTMITPSTKTHPTFPKTQDRGGCGTESGRKSAVGPPW